ncbi:MAG: ribosome silencing factor [Gammaproteobacteria bacterium]|nr:ribosome silencing factor [Gammaproteobacteria bacterium]
MQSNELMQVVAAAMADMKAVDVTTLDVAGYTSITDYMLIASGTSDRHVKSIADKVIEAAKVEDHSPLGVEGQDYGEWVLVDLGDVIVHIMQPKVRDFYKLENLWTIDDKSQHATDAETAG